MAVTDRELPIHTDYQIFSYRRVAVGYNRVQLGVQLSSSNNKKCTFAAITGDNQEIQAILNEMRYKLTHTQLNTHIHAHIDIDNRLVTPYQRAHLTNAMSVAMD